MRGEYYFTLITESLVSYSADSSVVPLGYGEAQHWPVQSHTASWQSQEPHCHPQVVQLSTHFLPSLSWFLFSTSLITCHQVFITGFSLAIQTFSLASVP